MMALFTYFIFSTLYMAPFFAVERFAGSPFPSRTAPQWWPRLFFLLLLQSLVNGLDEHVPLYVYLFRSPLPFISSLRQFWSEASPAFHWASAFLLLTFFHYWSHVARHKVPFLWRWCHKMHHSSERFESFLSLYIHPAELILLKVSFALTLFFAGFGLKILGTLSLIYFFINAWTHMNVRTPQWLGYIIFRPEQHALHHTGEDCNFGIIPLWDMIFGTFRNPKNFPNFVGVEASPEKDFRSILLGH